MEEFIHAERQFLRRDYQRGGLSPCFETGNVTPVSIMDIVNDNDNSIYYIVKGPAGGCPPCGPCHRSRAFGVKSRFVHFEFFRLTQDQPSMGKKGDVVALEVNMRPCGGFSPDMIELCKLVPDVYKIWADMIAFNRSTKDMRASERSFCAFVGRRDGKPFCLSDDDLLGKYAPQMRMVTRIPDALSGAMGNRMFVAVFPTKEAMDAFYQDALACQA